ncbi:amino acid transporter AVT1I-like [Chenopodium quinoa]|uniref:amino acid transporter AVT1I-like n=1 Tax=Chenopodium quinoa TaxID=63459 RepID=UPI000B76D191|nr:amino acid transporter AVT1I-like [Chenopodium quinoa]
MEGEGESSASVYVRQPLLENDLQDDINVKFVQEGDASFAKTLFNGLNALSGVGILSVPFALASGGWLSLTLLFTIALAAFYAGLLIKRCMEVDPSITSFPDIGERAFGNIGRTVVSVFMCAELYLVVTGFLIIEGDNLHNLFPEMNFSAFGLEVGGRKSFVLIVALLITPSVWLSNISVLSYISATGVLASVVIIVSVVWVGAFDGVGFHNKGELLNWSGIPTAVSLYGFCYCAHPIFPTLYHSMKKRPNFSKVLLLCFVCMTISYASIAILGYLMFGSKLDAEITLNLPIGKLSSKVAIYTTLVSPLSKYALMLEPVASATESWFPNYHKKRSFKILIRTALVASQVIIALTVPFFGHLISLVGAFLSITASITIPCLCFLKISSSSVGRERSIIIAIIVFSILIAIFGTYTSLVHLIHGNALPY